MQNQRNIVLLQYRRKVIISAEYTECSAADVKSKEIKASHYDWHKNWVSMKADSIQGQAGDKLFKQRLAVKIQIDVFSLVSAELPS